VLIHILPGELSATERLIEEDRLIAEATGNPPIASTAMALAAWQGREHEASELIEAASQVATARGTCVLAGNRLGKVFTKLAITSRARLQAALPSDPGSALPR
jgi:diphthamide biosynthesis methyltransferase